MVIQAQTPDGAIHEFPEGTPDSIIDGAVKSYLTPSYASNVGKDMTDSMDKIGHVWANPDLNPASKGIQMLGAASSGALSPMTEGIRSGYNSLPDAVTAPVNNATSSLAYGISGAYKGGVDKLADTGIGKAIGDYLINSPHIQNGMQEISDDAKAAGNIISVAPVEGAINKITEPVGQKLYDSGKASADIAHDAFVQKLVAPKETAAIKADNTLRTQQVNGKNIYNPTPQEQQVISSVKDIPGVSSSNSYQKNLNLVQKANIDEADNLKSYLKTNDVPIADDTVINTLSDVRKNLANNAFLSGVDASKAADNVVNQALETITKNPQTASGMLQARKELDALISRQKGDKAFNPALEGPVTIAIQNVRQAMNKMVGDAVPNANVQQSLAKQSALFEATDNIAQKASGEAATRLGRAIQMVSPHGLVDGLGKGAGLAGATYLASHLPIPPSVYGMGAAGYGIYRGTMSPKTRMALGKALGGSP